MTVQIQYHGFDYRDDATLALIRRFGEHHPDVKVNARLVPLPRYRGWMEDLFLRHSDVDAVYLGEEELAPWVRAGWLSPLDQFVGYRELSKDMFPYCLKAMTFEGRVYGVPAYSGFQVFVCNSELLARAGIKKPVKTLMELKDQALALQAAGICRFPLTLAFGFHPVLFFDFWALVYASGGRLFDEDYQPLFPDQNPTALTVLEWLVEALVTWKILDPASVEQSYDSAKASFAGSQAAFTSVAQYELKKLNDPLDSPIAGHAKAVLYPGLTSPGVGTLGWTRMFGMAAASKQPETTWRFLSYFGGKDSDGRYHSAEVMHLETDVGFSYRSLWDEAMIKVPARAWCDVELYRVQQSMARGREAIQAQWWPMWEPAHQEQIRRALRREVTPRQALVASAETARRLAGGQFLVNTK